MRKLFVITLLLISGSFPVLSQWQPAGERIRTAWAEDTERKISKARDEYGIMRIQLNNRDYLPLGTLDQGWWPDGLYTAPSDDALLYGIKMTRELVRNANLEIRSVIDR